MLFFSSRVRTNRAWKYRHPVPLPVHRTTAGVSTKRYDTRSSVRKGADKVGGEDVSGRVDCNFPVHKDEDPRIIVNLLRMKMRW